MENHTGCYLIMNTNGIWFYPLIVGCLAACAGGIIGPYIAARRLTFLTGSLSHAAFGGIGLSLLFGWPPLVGAMLFTVLLSWILVYVEYVYHQAKDSLISTIWALGMSIGIVCVNATNQYSANVMSYFFGDLLFTSYSDMWLVMSLVIGILAGVTFFYRSLQLLCFDQEYAIIRNLPIIKLQLLLISMIAITVVILVKVVGILLVIALLSLPTSAALNVTNRFRYTQVVAVIIGMLSVLLGTGLSFMIDIPTGASIIFCTTALYAMSLLNRRLS